MVNVSAKLLMVDCVLIIFFGKEYVFWLAEDSIFVYHMPGPITNEEHNIR